MIADTSLLSPASVVLIDEIENAGVDKVKSLELLVNNNKIVLISTHDPLLALSADQRLVIKNGGISMLLKTTEGEKKVPKKPRKSRPQDHSSSRSIENGGRNLSK